MKKFYISLVALLLVTSLVASFSLLGCKAEVAQETAAAETTAAAAETTAAAEEATVEAKPITIDYWENFIGASKAQNWALEQIKAKYPNLTINSINYTAMDLEEKLPTALASGTGPDLIYAPMDPKFLGRFANEDLVIPLTDGAKKYGWDKKLFPAAQAAGAYKGELYGIPHEFEVLAPVYNKKIFEELGLQFPKTLEDLEVTMDKIKKNSDYIPMFYGCGEGCLQGILLFICLSYAIVPVQKIIDTTVMGDGSYLEPEWKEVLQVLERWEKAGYFNNDTFDYLWEGHWNRFCNGEVAIMASGTALFKTLSDCSAENPDKLELGFAGFPVPEGKPFQAFVGFGSGWYISNNLEKDPAKMDIVLEFINLLLSDEAANLWITEDQLFPAFSVDQTKIPLNELQVGMLEIAQKAGSNAAGNNICWNNTSEENDAWATGFQALYLGKTDPDTIIKNVDTILKKSQAEWKSKQQ